MALKIRNSETERLAEAVAKLADELDEIARLCASLPIKDARPANEILGYDSVGLPR